MSALLKSTESGVRGGAHRRHKRLGRSHLRGIGMDREMIGVKGI
jgi:hypothetical protein